MSNSSLAKERYMAARGNYSKGRTSKITEITIHHMAGVLSAKQCGAIFQRKGREVSSNYGIGKNGEIALYVNEADTSYCNGNWKSNCRAVTIETSNSKIGGNWEVSDKVLKSLIKLVADIAYRNKLGTLVKGKNLTWHRMYVATTCPGNYLLSKMDYIVKEANKINNAKKGTASKPKTTTTAFKTGLYKTLDAMNVRSGAGTKYAIKKYKNLTADGKRNAIYKSANANAVYKKGTEFTALKIIKDSSGNFWAKTPSGYVCLKDKNETYCKKI